MVAAVFAFSHAVKCTGDWHDWVYCTTHFYICCEAGHLTVTLNWYIRIISESSLEISNVICSCNLIISIMMDL